MAMIKRMKDLIEDEISLFLVAVAVLGFWVALVTFS